MVIKISEHDFVAHYLQCPYCFNMLNTDRKESFKDRQYKGECRNQYCKVKPKYDFIVEPILEK